MSAFESIEYKEVHKGYKRRRELSNKVKEKFLVMALEFHINNESDSLTLSVNFINSIYKTNVILTIDELKEILFLYDPAKFAQYQPQRIKTYLEKYL
jgi:hypothetical protein